MRTLAAIAVAGVALCDIGVPAHAETDSTKTILVLPELIARDLPVEGKLFDRGLPVARDSFSPDGFLFAYLHQVPGGFPRRKPERCAFILDLGTLENRAVKTPKGRAARIGGWDPTGRYLLLESTHSNWFSAFTGKSITNHWVFDVVTSQFVSRKGFTGIRDGQRFRWKQDGTYHGVWQAEPEGPVVVPLEAGELAEVFQERELELQDETRRRVERAKLLAVGSGLATLKEISSGVLRLDDHWTRRGQKDPIISELFGERPRMYARRDSSDTSWNEILRELEYVAILDHGLVLATVEGGRQFLMNQDRHEIAPLPPVPPEFHRQLDARWDRSGDFYDEADPLPRDLQYRRSYDSAQGIANYFNYVPADMRHILLTYSIDAEHRILRVVDLPATWTAH
jgi:hypothetical protein